MTNDDGSDQTTYELKTADFSVGDTITVELEPTNAGNNIKLRARLMYASKAQAAPVEKEETEVIVDPGNRKPVSDSKKKKSSKKTGKSVKFNGKDSDAAPSIESAENATSTFKIGKDVGAIIISGVIQYRAIFLFGIAAVAVARYGDLASV